MSARMACAIGCKPPPPVPCMMRNRISSGRLVAIPHSSELSVNRTMHVMKNRLRPTNPAIQPLIGRMIALETRYDVNTQVLSSLVTPRLPAMWGSATLAMLVSRISMNAASATTIAIAQGFAFGRQIASALAAMRAGKGKLVAVDGRQKPHGSLGANRHGAQGYARVIDNLHDHAGVARSTGHECRPRLSAC